MRELVDLAPPWWVVSYNSLAAKTDPIILFDVYDCCRLCALSLEMIESIIQLNLRTVLWSSANVFECRRLLEAINSLFRH